MKEEIKETNFTIINAGRKQNELLVQKSKDFIGLSRFDFTLGELKIVDFYLARINSRKPEEREVVFTKRKLEELLGVKKINRATLEYRLSHLLGNVVKVPDYSKPDKTKLITLFEIADLDKNEDGETTIALKCTESAMIYIFNVEQIGYIKYKLKNILSLKTWHAYVLYEYIEANKFRLNWTEDVLFLRKMMNCETEYYDKFYVFNGKVLKKAMNEILENTDCRFTLKPVRISGTTSKVNIVYIPKNYEIESIPALPELPAKYDDNMFLWRHAVEPLKLELTEEQIDELDSIILTIPSYKLPEIDGVGMDDLDFRRFHYIDRIVKTIIRRDSEKKIKNRYNYLLQILKNEADS
jgi:hypothetical protein